MKIVYHVNYAISVFGLKGRAHSVAFDRWKTSRSGIMACCAFCDSGHNFVIYMTSATLRGYSAQGMEMPSNAFWLLLALRLVLDCTNVSLMSSVSHHRSIRSTPYNLPTVCCSGCHFRYWSDLINLLDLLCCSWTKDEMDCLWYQTHILSMNDIDTVWLASPMIWNW